MAEVDDTPMIGKGTLVRVRTRYGSEYTGVLTSGYRDVATLQGSRYVAPPVSLLGHGTVSGVESVEVVSHGVQERAVQDDSGRWLLVRQCSYCWTDYEERRPTRSYFCSPECSRRSAAWGRWIDDTNRAAVGGDVSKPAKLGPVLPPAGKTLEQVQRFAVQLELLKAVA